MTSVQRQWQWTRLAAAIALLSFLCFWAASAVHIHNAQGGMRQECQLCVASATSQTLLANASVAVALLLLLLCLVFSTGRPHIARYRHSSPPRSPPTLL